MINVLKGKFCSSLTHCLALIVGCFFVTAVLADFKGVVSQYAKDSIPHWPEEKAPPPDSPNVFIWMIDDVGFGQVANFGGLTQTDHLDELANSGLRFNNFHSTALCSPSRASILAGRNHHSIGMGAHANTAAGFPGYNARIPKSAAGIARILKDQGYATYAYGKWDHLPPEHANPLGPFDYWPSGQGFEHFYGFTAYDNHHFLPTLWRDHSPVDIDLSDKNYHLTTDIADEAIKDIQVQKSIRPDQPFFMYWATGAMHAPHHAPESYINKYRGKFDMGWNQAREVILARQKKLGLVPADAQLPPWPEGVPNWGSLSAEQQRMASKAMEVYAAMLEHTDEQFGRIVEALREAGELDNTIIIAVSDNGASAEGGLAGSFNELLMGEVDWDENLKHFDSWGTGDTYPHYPVGWAAAGNTPFKYYKQAAHEGGTRVPMIMSWPKGIERSGGIRQQFHHINDIVPTLLDMIGVPAPEVVDGIAQQTMDGVSFRYAVEDSNAANQKGPQYFELWGNRGIWADDWKAVALLRPKPWDVFTRVEYDKPQWELYKLDDDFNERSNVAEQYPEKLAELKALFDQQAIQNNVYPIGPDVIKEAYARLNQMVLARNAHFEYYPDTTRVPGVLAPPINLFSFTGMAELELDKQSGVIFSYGGAEGGMSLYLDKGVPVFAHNQSGRGIEYLRAKKSLPKGATQLAFTMKRTDASSGIFSLVHGDEVLVEGKINNINIRFPTHETFDIGMDSGSPVTKQFGGYGILRKDTLKKLVIDIQLPTKI